MSDTAVAFHFNVPDKLLYTCKLVRKLQRMEVPLVVTADADVAAALSDRLWAFGGGSQFLAHCLADAAPEVLQASPTVLAQKLDERLPHHQVLLNLQAATPAGFERFERVIEVVSAEDEADRSAARQRWRAYQAGGHAIERHDLDMRPDAQE
ncbi:MAG: DNA polymerase III subunit chi [Comamonas sp.]